MRNVALIVSIALISVAGAVRAQETKTGTLVPGAETSTMVGGLSTALRSSAGPSYSKADIAAINEARETMRRYTACLVAAADTKYEHAALVAFLNVPPQSVEAVKLANKTKNSGCVPLSGADNVTIRFTPDLTRGGMMRALYLETKRTPPLHRVRRDEIADAAKAGNATFDHLRRFGDCVVAKQPVEAERFLTSKIGSPAELALARALGPTLNACMEKGLDVHFSYGVLEGVLAEALFDRTKALTAVEQSEVKTADGRKQLADYVGPVKAEVLDRHALTGATAMGVRRGGGEGGK